MKRRCYTSVRVQCFLEGILSSASEHAQKTIVVAFFGSFFFLGIAIYGDYGISWDEIYHRYMGAVSAFYINALFGLIPVEDVLGFANRTIPVPALEGFEYKDYGVFFEVILAGCEYLFDVTDSRQIYLFRHFVTFLVFLLGIIFFYLISVKLFSSRILAIVSCVMLVVSPRIFAHGFYDLKDIAPLTLAITSLYTLIKLLEQRTLTMAMLHALSIALFIDTRVIGIFLPVVTITFLGIEFFKAYLGRESLKELCWICVVFVCCLLIFIYLFWPYLWEDPIHRFWGALTNMSRYGGQNDFDVEMLYFGNFISARNVPWHYLPVWIGITTPVVYLGLIVVGAFTVTIRLIRQPNSILQKTESKLGLLILIYAFGPLVAVIVASSTLLDGWRHMYFCYPALLLLAVMSLSIVREWTVNGVRLLTIVCVQNMIAIVLISSIAITAVNMYLNHPHQYAYFNILAGNNIAKNWELDYWGVSFRQGLEKLLAIDKSSHISISVSSEPGKTNLNILEAKSRKNLTIVDETNAKYHLSNYRFRREYDRFHAGEPPYDNEVVSISVRTILDEFKIMGVYRVK